MMLLFWLIMVLMIIVAIAFVLFPLVREQKTKLTYPESGQGMEISILEDLPTAPHPIREVTVKPRYMSGVLLACFVIGFSLFYYIRWGNSKELDKYYLFKSHAAEINAEMKKFKTPDQLVEKLRAVLKDHPDSARGWFLLGRLYAGMNEYQNAQMMFAKAIALNPANVDYKLQYAQTNFFANQMKLSPTASGYLSEVIASQPKNPSALNLIALNAYAQKQYHTAIKNWETLLAEVPAGSDDARTIMRAIHEAQLKDKAV